MQILASQMVNKWLIDGSQSRPVGELTNFIVDPDTLKLRYLTVSLPGERTASYIREDHIQWQQQLLLIQSASFVGEADEFVRDASLITLACNPIGYRVSDDQKRVIGRVQDFSFSSHDGKIERLMVRPIWWQGLWHSERIITRSAIKDTNAAKKMIIIHAQDTKISNRAAKPIPA